MSSPKQTRAKAAALPVRDSLARVHAALEVRRRPLCRMSLQFEMALYAVLVLFLLLQNHTIYRRNYYNYHVHLLLLSVMVLSRRVVLAWQKQSGDVGHSVGLRARVAAMPTLHVCIAVLLATNAVYLLAQLARHHHVLTFVHVLWPTVLYAVLLLHGNAHVAERKRVAGAAPASAQWSRVEHCIESVQTAVKSVVYDVVEQTWWCAVLPMLCLRYPYLFYDVPVAVALAAACFISSAVLTVSQLLRLRLLDVFHMSRVVALWTPRELIAPSSISSSSSSNSSSGGSGAGGGGGGGGGGSVRPPRPPRAREWDHMLTYKPGDTVLHRGTEYVCISAGNSVPSDRVWPRLIHFLLRSSAEVHAYVTMVQLACVVLQLVLFLLSPRFTVLCVSALVSLVVLRYAITCARSNRTVSDSLLYRGWTGSHAGLVVHNTGSPKK